MYAENTSLDYARLIRWVAWYKRGVLINKTQLQKIMFACYGRVLAETSRCLFNDDKPKAFPYGPVFPICYRRGMVTGFELTEDDKKSFTLRPEELKIVASTTTELCVKSARTLIQWSHLPGSPWYKAVFEKADKIKWGGDIEDEDIRKYFEGNWRVGL